MVTKQFQVGVAVTVALLVVGFFLGGNFFSMPQQQTNLIVQDQSVGQGAVANPGDTVTVNYTGKLANGTVFDTSVGRDPISFVLGTGRVIPGWDQGLVGMQVGGTRTLIIPPQLAYGSSDYGPIPANSTLTFEVQLVSVTPATTTPAAQ